MSHLLQYRNKAKRHLTRGEQAAFTHVLFISYPVKEEVKISHGIQTLKELHITSTKNEPSFLPISWHYVDCTVGKIYDIASVQIYVAPRRQTTYREAFPAISQARILNPQSPCTTI